MIGVDYKISRLQAVFAASLFTDIDPNTYESYGRAFLNRKGDDKVIPEVKTDNTREYTPVKFDDRKDGLSFFIVQSEVGGISPIDMTAEVDIFFAVNFEKLYPNVAERAMEYLHRDVMELIAYSEFEYVSYTQGYEAYSDFSGVKNSDNMQPYYLVKFSTKIEFQINENIIC